MYSLLYRIPEMCHSLYSPGPPPPFNMMPRIIAIFIFLLVKYGKIIHFYLFYLFACLSPIPPCNNYL